MNERIQKLAFNAGFIGKSMNPIFGTCQETALENFAELIVKECISIIKNAENGYSDYRNQIEDGMRDHCIALLKDKFGMKE